MGVISQYLASLPPAERTALSQVVDVALDVSPGAVDGRSYGVPALRLSGHPLIGVAAARGHVSILLFSPEALEGVRARLRGFALSQGTIHFDPAHPPPEDVLRDVVMARAAEIGREPAR